MSRMTLLAILICAALCVGAAADRAAAADGDFGLFYKAFKKALAAGNKEKVAAMIDFERFTWKPDERFRDVKDQKAFLANYGRMFKPEIKRRIERSVPIRVDDNSYYISWRTKDGEFAIRFTRTAGKGFLCEGLAFGP